MGKIIEIEHLTFSYPDTAPILSGLDLSIRAGEFVVLCGKSGCGKSTLLRQLKPALTPFGTREGNVSLFGKPIEQLTEKQLAEQVGFVFQNPDRQIVTDRVWHELSVGLENIGTAPDEIRMRVAEMSSYFDMQGLLERECDTLSGGQKQMLSLASVLVMHPDILVLDEPTALLDPVAAETLLQTVKKINQDMGTTVLISEHRLDLALPMADSLLYMEDGRIALSGDPKEVGMAMYEQDREMFSAMPVPMQIFAACGGTENAPLTPGEGRIWLENQTEGDGSNTAAGRRTDVSSQSALLSCKHAWFRYERDLPDVLKDFTLNLYPGEFYCLLGANGSGKTTALSLMCGLNAPYRGKIYIKERAITRYKDVDLYHNLIAVLPQDPQTLFAKMSVKEELSEMRFVKGNDKNPNRMREVIEMLHLESLLDQNPYDLSAGEAQRVGLAKILMLVPEILMLDEPTKGMDTVFKKDLARVLHHLKESGMTIFMITHDIEFAASYADRCGLMFNGEVTCEGTPETFFRENRFYTTAANKMASKRFPAAVTKEDVIACLNSR